MYVSRKIFGIGKDGKRQPCELQGGCGQASIEYRQAQCSVGHCRISTFFPLPQPFGNKRSVLGSGEAGYPLRQALLGRTIGVTIRSPRLEPMSKVGGWAVSNRIPG